MTDETKPTLEELQARAKEKAEAMRARRLEHGYISGTPGTLGEGNSDNSIGAGNTKPITILGLDGE